MLGGTRGTDRSQRDQSNTPDCTGPSQQQHNVKQARQSRPRTYRPMPSWLRAFVFYKSRGRPHNAAEPDKQGTQPAPAYTPFIRRQPPLFQSSKTTKPRSHEAAPRLMRSRTRARRSAEVRSGRHQNASEVVREALRRNVPSRSSDTTGDRDWRWRSCMALCSNHQGAVGNRLTGCDPTNGAGRRNRCRAAKRLTPRLARSVLTPTDGRESS